MSDCKCQNCHCDCHCGTECPTCRNDVCQKCQCEKCTGSSIKTEQQWAWQDSGIELGF